jgi:predicted porin
MRAVVSKHVVVLMSLAAVWSATLQGVAGVEVDYRKHVR